MATGSPPRRVRLGPGLRHAPRGRNVLIRAWNSSGCRTGLVRHAAIPRDRHRVSSSGWPADDRISRARPSRSGSARIRSVRANPSIPGIMMSIRATAKGCARRAATRSTSRATGPASTVVGRAPQWIRISSRIRRLVALSSTTSTGRPPKRGWTCSPRHVSTSGWGSKRAVKWKVLPRPTSLSTQIRPPISATSWAEIAKPSPVPPYQRVIDPSACANGSKMTCCFSGGMPMPVSTTAKCRPTSCLLHLVRRSTAMTTSPRSVNLMALPTRLTTICRSRPGSPINASGTSGAMRQASSSPLALPAAPVVAHRLLDGVAQGRRAPGPGRACRPRSWRSRGYR